jgi:flagella basal body P-ring formation protein FlgA
MRKIVTLLLLTACKLVQAQAEIQVQDQNELRRAGEDFLRAQTMNLPGKVTVSIGKVDSRLKLSACTNPTPFLLQGSKAWGKITFGIRCSAPKPWTIYLSAQIKVSGDYYVTANPITQGQIITATDLHKMNGDLSIFPIGVVTNPDQAIGKLLGISLNSGSVLKIDLLKTVPVIQQGQSIKIISEGQNFRISTDGIAINNATEGQIVKAKTASGQILNGIARAGGIIEIAN